ncbi:uncharacterized protein LOC124157964 [Ischnura elegans]|uniref:uncharacterized protein LOC124157964 n=1 Tax=Ischnura elegans TaxID=197161 RepID=UPI001ED87DD7|nr:uncharacterized protein LOC124157964 [Ischnura elegans]
MGAPLGHRGLPFKLVAAKELKQPGFYLKFLEVGMLIATVSVARLGKEGQPLSFHKTSVDADGLGRGVCIAYLIISPVLLLGYTVGEVSVQRRKMEFLFNAAGAFLLILSGSIAIDFWRSVGMAPIFMEKSTWERIRSEYTSAAHAEKNAGLCLGCLSVLTGFLYLADATFGYRLGGVVEKKSKQSHGHLLNVK